VKNLRKHFANLSTNFTGIKCPKFGLDFRTKSPLVPPFYTEQHIDNPKQRVGREGRRLAHGKIDGIINNSATHCRHFVEIQYASALRAENDWRSQLFWFVLTFGQSLHYACQ